MRFIKKAELERRKKVAVANKLRGEANRAKRAKIAGEYVSVGRRIFDLALLAQTMWCNSCNVALSFRYVVVEESQHGLASDFKIRCYKCLTIYEVSSSTKVADSTSSGPMRSLFAVNCKIALGKQVCFLLLEVFMII